MVGNKKLMIALFSICLVVIAGLLTTVIVLASPAQNVTSNINISYSATDIQGSMTAKYLLASSTADDGGATEFDGSPISFVAGDPDKTGTLNFSGPVSLSSSNSSIIFIYEFASTGDVAYDAVVTYESTTETNFKVEYATDASQAGSGWTELVDEGTQTVNVAANGTGKLYIRLSIEDTGKDATFNGNFKWALTATE